MFNITQPDYVFVDFGSTVDPLISFQFNISVSGQTLSYPRQSSFLNESCNLSDGQDSCKIALNLLAHTSEAMCIVGYRRRDRSGVPFGELTVKLTPIKPYKAIKIIFWIMISFVVLGSLILLVLCFVQVSICHKVFKSDSVASQGPSSVQPVEEHAQSSLL
jgi:hypothetical protein